MAASPNVRDVALLLIILSVFALWGFNSGSTGVSTTTMAGPTTTIRHSKTATGTTCVVVTRKRGEAAQQRPCHKAPAKP